MSYAKYRIYKEYDNYECVCRNCHTHIVFDLTKDTYVECRTLSVGSTKTKVYVECPKCGREVILKKGNKLFYRKMEE